MLVVKANLKYNDNRAEYWNITAANQNKPNEPTEHTGDDTLIHIVTV